LWVFVKVLFVSLLVAVFIATYLFSEKHKHEQHLDDWAKQSALLFQDTANFFSSLKSDEPLTPDTLDEELQDLLPSNQLNLRYEPDFESAIKIGNTEPDSILPSALLPNLFMPKQPSTGTSVKGQLFTDEKDNIIGAEVQLAIPTDM
jgi:hypothetical protein